jgi:hypothetical protein
VDGPPVAQERGGLFSRLAARIHHLFHHDEELATPWQVETVPGQPVWPGRNTVGDAVELSEVPATAGEPPLAGQSVPNPVGTTVPVLDGPVAPGPLQATGVAAPKLSSPGHDEQYHNITGRLAFLASGGGIWMVRYGDPDSDRFGGLVVLATAANMDGLRNGDMVAIQGELLNPRPDHALGAPIFRASEVTLIEHAE